MQKHARQAETEILGGGPEVAGQRPFAEGADGLIGQHDACQQQERRPAEPGRRPTCDKGQHDRLQQNRGQSGRDGHPEKQRIGHGRRKGRQQSRPPAVFVGADEGEEIDRQPRGAAQMHRMAQLRQGDVARYEKRRG